MLTTKPEELRTRGSYLLYIKVDMERKPRKKPKNRKIDYMKPLTIKDFGSENDPCFGKHYDLRADECARCGDYEACSIVSQSKMLSQMEKQEKKHRFKDIEEAELIKTQDSWAKKQMVKRARNKPGTWLSIDKFLPKFREHCNLTKVEDANLFQRLVNAAKASKFLTQKGSKYKYDE